MRTVPLSGSKAAGRAALVDDEDFDLVSLHPWWILESVRRGGGIDGPYARGKVCGEQVLLHAFITGHAMTDHVNGDGLDCRRINLRPATKSQNAANSQPRTGRRWKGVDLHRGKWRARIHAGGHPVHLGEFASAEDAATAYDVAAIAAFGEYACLNFPRLSHLS